MFPGRLLMQHGDLTLTGVVRKKFAHACVRFMGQ
jgi:hypothetical protein